MLKLYGSDVYEQFLEDPKCAECGELATQRCSRCKNEWYCSRECQLKKWKAHKQYCEVLTRIRKEDDDRTSQVKAMNREKAENTENVNTGNMQKKKPLIQEI